ncbi:MAG: hypothetical protein NVS4B10_11460 [Myxococcales bacterium]
MLPVQRYLPSTSQPIRAATVNESNIDVADEVRLIYVPPREATIRIQQPTPQTAHIKSQAAPALAFHRAEIRFARVIAILIRMAHTRASIERRLAVPCSGRIAATNHSASNKQRGKVAATRSGSALIFGAFIW